jgi:MFS family permease
MPDLIASIREDFKTFGPSTMLTVILVYSAQGFRSFGSIAETLFFKNTYGLDPSDLTIVSSITFIGWCLKPLYGLITDSLPIFGYRRKSYIIIAGFFGILSYFLILFVDNFWVAVAALIGTQMSQVVADVICDGYIVEKARIDPVHGASILQRYSWGSLFFASIIGLILGGNAADYIDPRYLIGALAICPVFVTCTAFTLKEVKDHESLTVKQLCKNIQNNIRVLCSEVFTEKVIRVIIFVLMWQASFIVFSAIYNYYLLDVLKVSPSTLAYIELVGYIGVFLATLVSSQQYFHKTILQKMIFGRAMNSALTVFEIMILTKYYETIGIPFYYFLFGPTIIGRAIGMFCEKMPIFVIFTKITPLKIEATFFALLSSIYNSGYFLSGLISVWIMELTGINDSYSADIWILFAVSMIIGFLSLPLLFILPGEISHQYESRENEKESAIEVPLLAK